MRTLRDQEVESGSVASTMRLKRGLSLKALRLCASEMPSTLPCAREAGMPDLRPGLGFLARYRGVAERAQRSEI